MLKLVAFNVQQVGNGFIVNEQLHEEGNSGGQTQVVLHLKPATLKKHAAKLVKELVEDSNPKEAA